MGRDVAEASPAAAAVFRRADDILGFELSKTCFEGPENDLTRTDLQQPAIFVTSVAIWEALRERGWPESTPQAYAGLSLGEYTALHVAGSVGFEDALKLVSRRGQLMQEAAASKSGGMVSIIGGKREEVEALCAEAAGDEDLVPANYNCPGQIVISGSAAACERAVAGASKHGLRGIMLKVAGGFHSPLMAGAAEGLRPVLEATRFDTPRCPVIGNVDASPHTGADAIRDALRRQVTEAVRWQQSVELLIEQGFDCFVEIGPGRVLTGLMRKINRKVKAVNVCDAAGLGLDAVARATT